MTDPSRINELFVDGPAAGSQARSLLIHFSGVYDAGMAGEVVTTHILESLPTQRLATFDSDLLVDYRSHRPEISVDDWVLADIKMPTIALDVVHDDAGESFLFLHGPEPDLRWDTFAMAVTRMVRDAGVQRTVSFIGGAGTLPHTRPTLIHTRATQASYIPEQTQMLAQTVFPATMSAFLQWRLAQYDIHGVELTAVVPLYMAEKSAFHASSALLARIAHFTSLSLPVGDVVERAASEATLLKEMMSTTPELEHTIANYEEVYDRMREIGSFPDPAQYTDLGFSRFVEQKSSVSVGQEMGEAAENYLAAMERLETPTDEGRFSTRNSRTDETPRVKEAEPYSLEQRLEDVLRRVAARESGKSTPSEREDYQPRYRGTQAD